MDLYVIIKDMVINIFSIENDNLKKIFKIYTKHWKITFSSQMYNKIQHQT